jgi:hypothetical protein
MVSVLPFGFNDEYEEIIVELPPAAKVVKEIEVCPIPESVAEQMAAKNEGSRN